METSQGCGQIAITIRTVIRLSLFFVIPLVEATSIVRFRDSKHCTLCAPCTHPTRTNKYPDFPPRLGLDFQGQGLHQNSTRFYRIAKFLNPETLAVSRSILGDFREFDESNGIRPTLASEASNFINSRNITTRCCISIIGLCITVFWYKCVILWDICFILSLLKCGFLQY